MVATKARTTIERRQIAAHVCREMQANFLLRGFSPRCVMPAQLHATTQTAADRPLLRYTILRVMSLVAINMTCQVHCWVVRISNLQPFWTFLLH